VRRGLATFALVANSALGCAFFQTAAPETPIVEDTPDLLHGDFDLLARHEVRSGARAMPPDVIVAAALEVAEDVIYALRVGDDDLPDLGANTDTDALTEAWLRVDEATNLAVVAAAPSPEPRPVSIERQRIAREERAIPPGELWLDVLNSREEYRIRLYDSAGRMRLEAIREASWAMRDLRAGRTRSVNPRLLAMLYLIQQHYDRELEVVSGYRVRGMNATEGSRHGAASACDIRIEGASIREIARFAESSFANVGVGYYPTSQFVHVDSRARTFYWVDYSGSGQRSRTRARSIDIRTDPADDLTSRSVHITEEELYQLPPSYSEFGYAED
jgi:uncharacterized protein YcbK (DUF882 family)